MNYPGDTASAFCIYRNILSCDKRERIFFVSAAEEKLKRYNFEAF